MARWASLIEQRRSERPVLLVDTGDFYPARASAHQELKDRYFFTAMNLLGYDAIGIGEYETRNDAEKIMASAQQFHLPFVSTNIMDRKSGKHITEPLRTRAFGERRTLFGRTGGWRVGIFCVARPELIYGFGDNPAASYDVVDPRIAALEAVNKLRRQGCSLVIGISHQGFEKSLELAREVPGIDLVINAHWSSGVTRAERVGRTLVVDPGQRETSFTEIEVVFKPTRPEITAFERCSSLLTKAEDPRFLKLQGDFAREMREVQFRSSPGGAPVDTTRGGGTASENAPR
jgi:2',3'-cyclic-nucleotide 2'-phosphodiesterase (5'-nucleotidase family)